MLLAALVLLAIAFNLDQLLTHAAWFYLLQHAGIMCGLGFMFGSTLGTHENALCSRIARIAIAARWMPLTSATPGK
jgi:hypothetical protein